ncbi:reverse transcriptase domain-containing protein [Tanacetum coccineum]
MKLLDTGIIYPIADSPWISPIHCVPKKGGITVVPNENDELVPTRTVTRMPFGLCNAPATFQRCMLAIFHDMIKESVEVFMDDFSVFGDSFDKCLNNLDKMLQRWKDAHLVLNWEKCHFMVKEGIVIGHKVTDISNMDKNKPKRTKPEHEIGRVQEIKAEGCMSTRSTSSNLFSPLRDPESLIRRRNLGEPSSLFDFEEVMSIPHNNQGPPPAGPPPPNNNGPPSVVRPNGPAPRSMEELCQPSINGRGGPIAPILI